MVSGIAISLQSGLEFLGLGDVDLVSWGVMLSEGFRNIFLAPLLILWPALTISLTIGALALLGNALRDALEDLSKPSIDSEKKEIVTSQYATTLPGRPTESHLIDVQDIAIAYPDGSSGLKHVVHNVSFHVDRGEVLGIVGESGSGKTQTAFSILGLLPSNAEITGGAIYFGGEELLTSVNGEAKRADMSLLRGKKIA
jgi:ABC-type multidrug transport system fused ATPase/permease subunit